MFIYIRYREYTVTHFFILEHILHRKTIQFQPCIRCQELETVRVPHIVTVVDPSSLRRFTHELFLEFLCFFFQLSCYKKSLKT